MEILAIRPGACSMMLTKAVNHTKRWVKIVCGFAILLAGLIMLLTPGPGWPAIFAGLAILATEFHWAKRLLARLKHEGIRLFDRIRKSPRGRPVI
jgi:uncharacterized protein (TIGR02611 family)